MRVLFVSNDLIAGHLAYLLRTEGHDVRLFIQEEGRRNNFDGLVEKSTDWKADIEWVGKDGLIVFDDIGFGEEQDRLRAQGYAVFGGSALGDKLEQDRVYGQEIFASCGMRAPESHDFPTVADALAFAEAHRAPWVVKQNGHSSKSVNYVGFFDDGRDVLDVLRAYTAEAIIEGDPITLQKRVEGEEIAVTRYFNGSDWIGPSLINIEHKKFFPGDLGPTTSEMGTLGWYDTDEQNPLYLETLAKLKPFLAKAGYRGVIDINCIVNESGVYPLEATSRPGSPIVHLQTELNHSPWSELLLAIAKGEPYDLQVKKGEYAIVVAVTVPPFPYAKKIHGHSQIGTQVYFLDAMTPEDMTHVHFEEISWHAEKNHHYISDDRGYVLYVTGTGESVEAARTTAYGIIKKLYVPKMMYRTDIGRRFVERSRERLTAWGYLPAQTAGSYLAPILKRLSLRS